MSIQGRIGGAVNSKTAHAFAFVLAIGFALSLMSVCCAQIAPQKAPKPLSPQQMKAFYKKACQYWHLKKTGASQAKIDKILTESQRKRLQQIRIQDLGALVLSNAEIIEMLAISAQQKAKIDHVRETKLQEVRRAIQAGDRPSRERMAEIRKELESSMLAILTPAQLAKLDELKGKPFDLSQLHRVRDSQPQKND